MEKIIKAILIATLLATTWSCSSSDSDIPPASHTTPTDEVPKWEVVMKLPEGQPGRPDWQEADFFQFENTMTIILSLEDEMIPFLSEDDEIAAIVNGEVRVIAPIKFYGQGSERTHLFMLLVPFGADDEDTDLFYYNAQTKQTWLLTSVSLREDDTLGSVTDFKVSLFKSCELSAKLGASVPFTPAANDLLAVFADDVCCGVGTYDAEKKEWSVKAYNLSPTTTEAHFRYYSAEKQQIFKTPVMFDFKSIQRTILTPYYLNFK